MYVCIFVCMLVCMYVCMYAGTCCAPYDGPHTLRDPAAFLGHLFKSPVSLIFFVCVVCWCWGCFHISGIVLGTSCAPNDGPFNLVDPSLLGNVPLVVALVSHL